MNLKKYLQKQAEKDSEALLTEEDRQFCMQLAENVEPEPVPVKRNKVTLWASLSSAIAVALVAVIVLPVVLTQKTPPANEIFYQEEFVDYRNCLLADVNEGCDCFLVEQIENYEYSVRLYYDTVSDDTLFYLIDVNALFSEFYIYIVTNKNYNLQFKLNEELDTEQLINYELNYQTLQANVFGGTQTGYRGVITLNEEIVYIDYTQTVDLGEFSKNAFFEDIQSVLKVK